jgi:hypothetical protein
MLTEIEIQTLITIFNKIKDIKDEQGEFPSSGVRQNELKIVLSNPQNNEVVIKIIPRPNPN